MSTDTRRFTVGGSDCGAVTTPCVEWHTADADGYPRLRVGTRRVRVHRLMYEAQRGEIPAGYVVHHACENKRCVNPEHLRAVSRADHTRLHAVWQLGTAKAAENRRNRTTCNHGHPFTPENTYYNGATGTRFCRECHLSRKREAWRLRREAMAA